MKTSESSASTPTIPETRSSPNSCGDGPGLVSVLRDHGFVPVDRTGSHLKLRYEDPDTGEVRIVTVPMKPADDIPVGTLRSIADQSGAEDFREWCAWIEKNC